MSAVNTVHELFEKRMLSMYTPAFKRDLKWYKKKTPNKLNTSLFPKVNGIREVFFVYLLISLLILDFFNLVFNKVIILKPDFP